MRKTGKAEGLKESERCVEMRIEVSDHLPRCAPMSRHVRAYSLIKVVIRFHWPCTECDSSHSHMHALCAWRASESERSLAALHLRVTSLHTLLPVERISIHACDAGRACQWPAVALLLE